MKEKLFPIIALLLVCSLLFGGLTWLNTQILQHVEGGEHFLVSWMRARSFIVEGKDPYSEAVTQDVQVAVYGRYAQEEEYSYALDVPLYKLFAYFPFALIKDVQVAFALWMSFAELALLGIGFLSVNLSGWKPSLLSGALFYLTLLFSFYGFYPLLGGSGIVFTTLLLLLMLLAIREGWNEVLGVLLVFGTFFPTKGGVLFLLLLIWIIYEQHWLVFAIASMTLISLMLFSSLILPDWLSSYYQVLTGELNLRDGFFLSDFLYQFFPNLNFSFVQILRWGFLSLLLVEWFNLRKRNFQHLLWVIALNIAIVPFLEIPISPYYLSFFLFPLPLFFKSIEDRWRKYANWFSVVILLFALAAWLFVSDYENALELLIFVSSGLFFVGLYWVRWWSLRIPRTWWDEARNFQ